MWYFSWILGVGLAASFAVLNAMWFEMKTDTSERRAEATIAAPAERRP